MQATVRHLCQDASHPVVVITDGANWIKTEQERHVPQTICILDWAWAHLWPEVNHAIRSAARVKSLPAQECNYLLHLHEFWHRQVELAIQRLQRLATDLPADALKTARQAITYLENQHSWIEFYDWWHAPGYPAGSCMIELAYEKALEAV